MTERDELEAIGSEGSLFLDDPWHCKVPRIELRRAGRVERIELDVVDSYRLELENLSDAIRAMPSCSSAATTQSHRPAHLERCMTRRCTAHRSRCDAFS